MTTPTVAPPTQVTHSTRAALRTALQTFIPGLIAALAVLPPLIQSIVGDASVPGWLRGWLTVAAAGVAVVAGIVAKVMNVPGVNAWLTKLGIGAKPAGSPVLPGVQVQPPTPNPQASDLSTLDKLDGLGKPPAPTQTP